MPKMKQTSEKSLSKGVMEMKVQGYVCQAKGYGLRSPSARGFQTSYFMVPLVSMSCYFLKQSLSGCDVKYLNPCTAEAKAGKLKQIVGQPGLHAESKADLN